jgi:hypothetical protein
MDSSASRRTRLGGLRSGLHLVMTVEEEVSQAPVRQAGLGDTGGGVGGLADVQNRHG